MTTISNPLPRTKASLIISCASPLLAALVIFSQLTQSSSATPRLVSERLLLLGGKTRSAQTKPVPDERNRELGELSKRAIIEVGFSEAYFNAHFELVRTSNAPGNIEAVWKYSLNGYETTVVDSIGYYTDEQQRRIFVHSVKSVLGAARDITKTIPRKRAQALMKACIGNYSGEAIELMLFSPAKSASLYLTAHSIPKPSRERSGKTRERVEEKEEKKVASQEADRPEREENEKRPPVYLGYVNLETGRCIKGRAIVAP